jgi:hypothetical protein
LCLVSGNPFSHLIVKDLGGSQISPGSWQTFCHLLGEGAFATAGTAGH